MLFLTTILVLVLVILVDLFLSFSAELYDTLAYFFDVTDEIIVHPMHHVVLKVGLEAHLATLSERPGPCKPCAYCRM